MSMERSESRESSGTAPSAPSESRASSSAPVQPQIVIVLSAPSNP
eukprot:gene1672-12739_t